VRARARFMGPSAMTSVVQIFTPAGTTSASGITVRRRRRDVRTARGYASLAGSRGAPSTTNLFVFADQHQRPGDQRRVFEFLCGGKLGLG